MRLDLLIQFSELPAGVLAVRATAAAIVKTAAGEDHICEESIVSVLCGNAQFGDEGSCRTDADCGGLLKCRDGICTQFEDKCTVDSDCPSGYYCTTFGNCAVEGSSGGGGGGDGGDGGGDPCPDGDGDGYQASSCSGNDCDDTDDQVNPGMTEICTGGVDDDCDGDVDGADSDCQSSCMDGDGDGYGDPGDSSCSGGPEIDCDDTDDQVNPGMTETGIVDCSDYKDNDCDGSLDGGDTACDGSCDFFGHSCTTSCGSGWTYYYPGDGWCLSQEESPQCCLPFSCEAWGGGCVSGDPSCYGSGRISDGDMYCDGGSEFCCEMNNCETLGGECTLGAGCGMGVTLPQGNAYCVYTSGEESYCCDYS
ncbi:MAG: MopE-related protein [archaeon]